MLGSLVCVDINKEKLAVTSSLLLLILVIIACFVLPFLALRNVFPSGRQIRSSDVSLTLTLDSFRLKLCRPTFKNHQNSQGGLISGSAQVQQILNQNQHPCLCQAAVQSAPCRCGTKLLSRIKAHQSIQEMARIVREGRVKQPAFTHHSDGISTGLPPVCLSQTHHHAGGVLMLLPQTYLHFCAVFSF